MNVFSPAIILVIVIGLLFFWNINENRRENILVLISLSIILVLTKPIELILLIVFVYIGFIFMRVSFYRPTHKTINLIILIWISLYLLLAGYIQQLSYWGINRLPTILGISYILFRVLQILLDQKEGVCLSLMTLKKYLLYTLNFLTLLSGPIQRVEDFDKQIRAIVKLKFSDIDHLSVFHRLSVGLVKVFFLAAVVKAEHEILLQSFSIDLHWEIGRFAFIAMSYIIFLYLNFSGYMDIVVSVGKLFGFELPENFNRPFVANDFLDFWERWHISLSSWMKDYFFTPLFATLLRWKSNYWWGLFFGMVSYFFTFLLLGIWHGSSYSFVLCGLMLALGASISKVLQVTKLRLIWGKHNEVKHAFSKVISRVLASVSIAHISISIMGFWLTMEQIILFWNRINIYDIFMLYMVSTSLAIALFLWVKIVNAIASYQYWSSRFIKEIIVGVNLYLLLFSFFEYRNIVPEFVYQGF